MTENVPSHQINVQAPFLLPLGEQVVSLDTLRYSKLSINDSQGHKVSKPKSGIHLEGDIGDLNVYV